MPISKLRGSGGVEPPDLRERLSSTRPSSAAASSIEDRVTISSVARTPSGVPEELRPLSVQAHADPKLAEQLAYDYAHTPQSPLIDISGLGSGPARYAATGEAVTPESERRYKEMSDSLMRTTKALYAQEKASGTPAADLLDKLLATIGSQPADFRNIIGLNN